MYSNSTPTLPHGDRWLGRLEPFADEDLRRRGSRWSACCCNAARRRRWPRASTSSCAWVSCSYFLAPPPDEAGREEGVHRVRGRTPILGRLRSPAVWRLRPRAWRRRRARRGEGRARGHRARERRARRRVFRALWLRHRHRRVAFSVASPSPSPPAPSPPAPVVTAGGGSRPAADAAPALTGLTSVPARAFAEPALAFADAASRTPRSRTPRCPMRRALSRVVRARQRPPTPRLRRRG